jgi:glycosyltransferase involved in cell wall biosynthesis
VARVCVIRQCFFPLDTRVRREVHALAAAGHEVDVICVRRPGQARRERVGRVTVHRLCLPNARGDRRIRYLLQYAVFGTVAAALVAVLHCRRRFDIVQVNSMPDALVFAAAVPRLLGARVLLDLHECMPEFFQVKYGVASGHPTLRVLSWAEQASIRFADRVITCTEQMRQAFVERGASPEKIDVVLNSSDEAIFDARRYPPAPRRPDRFTLICHGAIERSYGLETLVRAAALVRDEIPGLRIEIFGEGTYRPALERLVRRLDLDGAVRFSDGFAPIEELLTAIAGADAGVVAVRRDVFRDLTHCNKMFDLVAMRRPAIVSRTRAVEAYFGEACFAMFESGDERDLARAVRALHRDQRLGERLVARALEVSRPYRWSRQRRIYLGVVEHLAGSAAGGPAEKEVEAQWPAAA